MQPLTRRAFGAGAIAAGLLPTLASAQIEKVPWGIAVATEPFRDDPAYRAAIAARAGLVVPMNALKWATLRYERDVFNFGPADSIVAFAEGLKVPVHGHNLLWYDYNPAWLDAITSRAELLKVLETHIERVVGRYRGRIRSWDVVNEVLAHDPARQGRWRDGVWQRVLGPAQVEIAFAMARAADPSARLYINDYDLEDDTSRTERRQAAMLAIVRRLQQRNIQVDAVGLQAHLYAERRIGTANLRAFVRTLKAMGVGVAVTELDVIDWKLPLDTVVRDRAVADTADAFLDAVFTETVPEFVATWGLSDRYSWIAETFPRDEGLARPLPLDAELRSKPLLDTLARYVSMAPR